MNISREDLDARRIDFSDVTDGTPVEAASPGDILRLEFMQPLGLSARSLARELGVPTNRVTAVLNATRAITADTALRLAERLGTTPEFWLNLQMAHDLRVARLHRRAA